ncbi:MAG: penicillin-binding protein 2 [Parcubacteria group bacterium]|nr:penicillin-binding protein 2 [Parcubacteria group bacterium]MCR4342831.1 penicillin-binding protein 2 [Patescibacteria group bacterium]
MKDPLIRRLHIVGIIIFLFAGIIIAKLFMLQIVSADYYKKEANKQYVSVSEEEFDRGKIFFKEKNNTTVSAASVKSGFVLALTPSLLPEDKETVYNKLINVVNIDKEDFLNKADKKDDPFEDIAHKLTSKQAEIIKNYDIPGVKSYQESWRLYPAGSLSSHILGFVGYKENKLIGRYGIEKYYEDVLKRGGEGDFLVNSFAEIFLDVGKELLVGDKKLANKEGDVVLTIEPKVQFFLEETLGKIMDKWNGSLVGGIIIEPKTGKILAMAAKPDFDPNYYGKESDLALFVNPNVESVFEFGSIMKPLTVAAALNDKVITPGSTYNDEGYVLLNGARIENYDGKARGIVDMQEVLNHSLNTGAVFAMQRLGKDRFYDYIIKYGFGDYTGIDLPGEVKGLISNLDSFREIEYATASFGQGIALTPVEMARALSSLANGGNLMKPYIVDSILVAGGPDINIEPKKQDEVISKETSDKITAMLVKTVDEALFGGIVKMDNYSIAAKTGTAQLASQDGNGYDKNKYLHSFFGYGPAYDSRFLVFLYVKEPIGARYASETLTYPFMDLMKFLLNYYEVPPDR